MRRIVLMYHCIYKDNGNESGFQNESAFQYKLSAEQFEKQVKIARNYLINNNIPDDYIEFTFDDGGVSFFTLAMPILEKYGFKGTFFIATSFIDSPLFLTRGQIREIRKRGHVIASHSNTHCENMTLLSYEQMKKEWEVSCNILKDIIGEPVDVASIPNGYGSNDVYDSAQQAGIKTLYSSIPTTKIFKRKNIDIVGRYVIHANTSTEEFYKLLSSKSSRFQLKVRYDMLQAVHTVLGKRYNAVKAALLKWRS